LTSARPDHQRPVTAELGFIPAAALALQTIPQRSFADLACCSCCWVRRSGFFSALPQTALEHGRFDLQALAVIVAAADGGWGGFLLMPHPSPWSGKLGLFAGLSKPPESAACKVGITGLAANCFVGLFVKSEAILAGRNVGRCLRRSSLLLVRGEKATGVFRLPCARRVRGSALGKGQGAVLVWGAMLGLLQLPWAAFRRGPLFFPRGAVGGLKPLSCCFALKSVPGRLLEALP